MHALMRWYKCFTKTFASHVFSFLSATGRACLLCLRLEVPRYQRRFVVQQTEGGGWETRSCMTSAAPLQMSFLCKILRPVSVRVGCTINPLYLSSPHTRNRENLLIQSHFWALCQQGRAVQNMVLQKQTGISSCQAEREDWAVGQVTSTPHSGKFSHYFQDLLKLADKPLFKSALKTHPAFNL